MYLRTLHPSECFCFLHIRAQRIAGPTAGGVLPRPSTDHVRRLHQEAFSRPASSLRKAAANVTIPAHGEPQDD